jgi:hypothetical protein
VRGAYMRACMSAYEGSLAPNLMACNIRNTVLDQAVGRRLSYTTTAYQQPYSSQWLVSSSDATA